MSIGLMKRYVDLLPEPILQGEDWNKFAHLSAFPLLDDLEFIRHSTVAFIDTDQWDVYMDAYVKGCPLARKIWPYLFFFIRTCKVKLTQTEAQKWLGVTPATMARNRRQTGWVRTITERQEVRDKLKIAFFTCKKD